MSWSSRIIILLLALPSRFLTDDTKNKPSGIRPSPTNFKLGNVIKLESSLRNLEIKILFDVNLFFKLNATKMGKY